MIEFQFILPLIFYQINKHFRIHIVMILKFDDLTEYNKKNGLKLNPPI